MELKDLKTGMVVETRDGCCMTLDGECPHKSNMTWPDGSNLDIMKVFKPALRKFSSMLSDERNCIWNREKVRKMTVSEICKELGYEVEIAKE